MKRWRKSDLGELAGRSSAAAIAIVDLVEKRAITVGGSNDDRVAWGQYLDEQHHSILQWGFYGTSAGIQVLAMKQRLVDWEQTPRRELTVDKGLMVLPESMADAENNGLFESKRNQGDFRNPVKLAFILDALVPYRENVVEAETPALVEELLDLAVEGKYWTARTQDDSSRSQKEKVFPTALVLYALARYERARNHPTFGVAREWLAQNLATESKSEAPEQIAMSGLALRRSVAMGASESGLIADAIEHAQSELAVWSKASASSASNRPVFIGFSLGDRTDYMFLSPEVLAALFFLRIGNPEATKKFVLRTVDGVANEAVDNNGVRLGTSHISTVDQLWAMRLLTEFCQILQSTNGASAIAPKLDQSLFLYSAKAKIIAATVLVGVIGISAGIAEESLITGLLLGVATASAAVVAVLVDQARKS